MPLCPVPSLYVCGLGLPLAAFLGGLPPGQGAQAPAANPEVLVAGCRDHRQPAATLWADGQATPLAGPRMVRVNAMVASGRDVFTAGWAATAPAPPGPGWRPTQIAMVWKNGAGTALTGGATYGVALAVGKAGRDIYAAGADDEHARLWKNREARPLADGGARSWARALVLDGGHALVAGNMHSGPGGTSVAVVWRDGKVQALTDGSREACAKGIAVAGRDVYVAGYESNGQVNVAKVWKNGVPLPPLSDGSRNAEAEAVAVVGGAVLVAGSEAIGAPVLDSAGNPVAHMPVATLWRDGAPVRLTDGSRFAWAHALASGGTRVYVAGEEYRSSSMSGDEAFATVWRLDPSGPAATRLTDGSTAASAAAICLAGAR